MNEQQKRLFANIVIVVVFTTAMVVAFANIKDAINRSEASRAMEILGKEILRYRETTGSLPPESYVDQYIEEIRAVRLSGLQYRAPWIEFGSDPNKTVLAYSEREYRGIVKGGGIILWLNGKVEWMNKKQLEQTLARQQKEQELKWLRENLRKED